MRHHEVVFYLDDRQLLNHVTKLIGEPLKSGHSAIVMATESHRNSLVRRLQAYGLDCDTAIAQGRYIVLDAADVLSTFMLNGMPDSIGFMEAFRNLVQRASKAKGEEPSRIPIFGECVRILVEQANAEAAIQMEELGN